MATPILCQGPWQGCVLAPLLFGILCTVVLNAAEQRFTRDADVADLVSVGMGTTAIGGGVTAKYGRRKTPREVRCTQTTLFRECNHSCEHGAVAQVCHRFGLAVSKTDAMFKPQVNQREASTLLQAQGTGISTVRFLGGAIAADTEMSAESQRRT